MTTISVVIPACDRPPEYLVEAIASVRAQALPVSEIIVADNGTRPVDPAGIPGDVVLLRLPARIGASRARNFGAAAATGQTLAFLDDDDRWAPTYLEEVLEVMETEDAQCVYARVDTYLDGQRVTHKCPSKETLVPEHLLRRNPGTLGSNLVVEKALFDRIGGFDERLHTAEDKAFALAVLRANGKIAAAPKAIAFLRQHDGDRLSHSRKGRWYFLWLYRRSISGDLVLSVLAQPFRWAKRALRNRFIA